MTEFSYDAVGLNGYYEPPLTGFYQGLSAVGIIALIVVLVYQFGYRNSKQLSQIY